MTTEKTEMQFPYSPPDFFEAEYRRQTDEYILVADSGVVRITLCVPSDPIDAELQNRITKEVEALFRIRHLQVHRSVTVESVRVQQHRENGTRVILKGVESTLKFPGAPLDFIMRDASGAVVSDTRAERIADHTKFIDSMMPKLARSPQLMALLQSYEAAVKNPANELVHLYDIRDALAKYYGGKSKACRKLQIDEAEWDRLGILANTAPLKEGRHRGKHSELRHASAAELDEARKIARRWIETFANQF
jgi:hypothetical protein